MARKASMADATKLISQGAVVTVEIFETPSCKKYLPEVGHQIFYPEVPHFICYLSDGVYEKLVLQGREKIQPGKFAGYDEDEFLYDHEAVTQRLVGLTALAS